MGLGRVEEAAHAAAEVGGLGEVGCVFGAWAAEGEDSGFGGDLREDFVGLRGGEVDDVIEMEGCGHREIVVGMLSAGLGPIVRGAKGLTRIYTDDTD